MKQFFFGILIVLLTPLCIQAQIGGATAKPSFSNPVKWTFNIKKTSDDTYNIEAKASIDKGFHIWAIDPGGDGSLIPTSFTTEQLSNGKWISEWLETTNPKVETLDFIDGAIKWHEKQIIFYRTVKAASGTMLKGAVQYQTCNEMMCLPPAVENFNIIIP